jgi:transcriptional regulator NrdR family protein
VKGCPFCVHRETNVVQVADENGIHFVRRCTNCGCEGPLGETLREADTLWNKRPCGE